MTFIKRNLDIFVGVLLILCILFIFLNACFVGLSVLTTQYKINETYRIH